jgi:uncharacterized iron-regulated protein
MKSSLLISFIFSFFFLGLSQDNPAYVIYNKAGKKVSFSKMEKAVLSKKYIFFGEQHNDPIAHWLQFQILESLFEKHKSNLMAGSEMFERDNQAVINRYLNNQIDEKKFQDSCRLWTNFETDYKPMLDFAKQNHIPWIATNIPRKFASQVFKKGVLSLDSLSIEQKKWICPLPFALDTTLSQYAALSDGEMHMGPNFVRAQAIKDATMALSIKENLNSKSVFYHLNGAYHSDFHQGILWYLQQYNGANLDEMITISTVSQLDISTLDEENRGKADFIICVPENMTKTH